MACNQVHPTDVNASLGASPNSLERQYVDTNKFSNCEPTYFRPKLRFSKVQQPPILKHKQFQLKQAYSVTAKNGRFSALQKFMAQGNAVVSKNSQRY